MRPREDELIDPEIAEQLDAIDATLAGDPVDPRFAELAELALMLRAERPDAPRPDFAAELDGRVQARFRSAPPSAPAGGAARPRRRSWLPALGVAGTALAAVVAAVVVVGALGGGGSSTTNGPSGVQRLTAVPSKTRGPAGSAAAPGNLGEILGPARHGSAGQAASGAGRGGSSYGASAPNLAPPASPPPPTVTTATSPTLSPAPLPNGRRIIQSSTLVLGARPKHIDIVAQQVFNVVADVNGYVQHSNVVSTGGLDANAQFELRVPSSNLAQALTMLSRLRYASVISRIDATQDVNSPYLSTGRSLAAAERLRARLRRELAAATTDAEIATLKAKLAAVNATIATDSATLTSLTRRIAYSQVYVSLQATIPATGSSGGGGGFGLRQAGHDAIRVLEVSAGVALIALAVLLPLALLAALGWWIGMTVQRRRRERALDMA